MAEVKPEYYKNNNGNDLFDDFEAGLMTEGETRGFYKGNIYKYLTRYEAKAGIQDLEKADTYMQRLIAYEKKLAQEEQAKAQQDTQFGPQLNHGRPTDNVPGDQR